MFPAKDKDCATKVQSVIPYYPGPVIIMSQRYPEVQGGGSLIVAWQVRDKNVLLVGGGEVRTGALKEALISAQIYIHGCRLTKQR